MASKRGIPPTVCNFQTLLTSKLTQHDVRESKREMKRGSPNIYRLGHLLKAAHEVEADVARAVPNCNVVMTPRSRTRCGLRCAVASTRGFGRSRTSRSRSTHS